MDLEYKFHGEFGIDELADIWSQDYFEALRTVNDAELSHLMETVQNSESGVVLNDRLMTEASIGLLNHPKIPSFPIKDEHSYSRCNGSTNHEDIDSECFPAISITEAEGTLANQERPEIEADCMSTSDTVSCCDDSELCDDLNDEDSRDTSAISDQPCKCSDQAVTILEVNKKDKIIQKTSPSEANTKFSDNLRGTRSKEKPMFLWQSSNHDSTNSSNEHVICFPPTPPSSFGSDSESGCSSPPQTPLYDTLSPQFCGPIRKQFSKHSTRTPINTPLISSQPKGATGDIHLTEEEKRTLVSEGYPVPSRLPLTKAEEKSLKKIRRKIKNKISAQESRRKKKEYMDTLEGKVEVLEKSNRECKRKLEILQNKNSSLLEELHRLQAMVSKKETQMVQT